MKRCHFVTDTSDHDEPLCVFNVLNMASVCELMGWFYNLQHADWRRSDVPLLSGILWLSISVCH